MSDQDLPHDPEPDDELDRSASDWLDGQDGDGPVVLPADGDPRLAARVASFEEVRAQLLAADPPTEALERAVDAALDAYDEAQAARSPTASATVPPAALSAARARRARRARWLAPLGAAAAVAALLGVATLASRDDSSGGDAASSAPAETEAATFEATTSADAADAGRTEAQALSGDETLDSPAAGRAAGAATLPQLGSFRTLDELASQLEEADGAATLAAPTSLPSVAPPAVPTTPPAPATDCAEGVPLGEATLAGQPVTVLRRPDGSLVAIGAGCSVIEETAPTTTP